MNWKRFWKVVIYPHVALIWLLLPISAVLLTLSLIYLDSTSILSIIAYLIAFYELLVICFRIPDVVAFIRKWKTENRFLSKVSADVHLRMNLSLYGSLIFNVAFGLFQLGLGIYHHSLWFYSMSAYYVVLAVIRFFLLRHTRHYGLNEECERETKLYILCGWLLLLLNLALAVILFLIVYENRTFNHHEITTITIASYTFLTFTFAIVNSIKYRKFNSPTYSASKTISLVSACVSMLTLETSMLTTFGGGSTASFRQIILAITGCVIIVFVLSMAVYMIVHGGKNLKVIKEYLPNNENGENY